MVNYFESIGVTRYLSAPKPGETPVWRRIPHPLLEIIFARGLFVGSATSSKRKLGDPSLVELNPTISPDTRSLLEHQFVDKGAVVLTPREFEAVPFEYALVASLFEIASAPDIKAEVYYD